MSPVPPEPSVETSADVTRLNEIGLGRCRALARALDLTLVVVPPGRPLPGSYWGDDEAGLVGATVYVYETTPVHSLLHEALHFVCMDDTRRAALDTDAGGEAIEECAVCYLQVLVADAIPGYGRARMFADMDAWGYSFRLGSARRWFEADADDARAWLEQRGLVPDVDGLAACLVSVP